MSADSTFGDSGAAQQRYVSLFLRSEREIIPHVAILVSNVTDAEDIACPHGRQEELPPLARSFRLTTPRLNVVDLRTSTLLTAAPGKSCPAHS